MLKKKMTSSFLALREEKKDKTVNDVECDLKLKNGKALLTLFTQ